MVVGLLVQDDVGDLSAAVGHAHVEIVGRVGVCAPFALKMELESEVELVLVERQGFDGVKLVENDLFPGVVAGVLAAAVVPVFIVV